MTSGTLYRLGRPRLSLRPLSSPSVPHHLYRGAEIEGPKFERLRPEPMAHALHSAPTERPAQLGNEGGEGRGSCTGPVEVNRGPLMTFGSGQAHWRLYVVPTGPPSHLPRTAFLTVGTASSLSRGRNLKSSPCTHRTGSALAHRTAGPTGKPMRRGAGVPARGPVAVNRGPLMTSGLVRLIGGCTVYRLGRSRISLRPPLSSPSVRHPLYRGAEI
jgi:hypothetical protein